MASHFVWTNRSKESLTLDIKQPAAREVLDELIADADILVQNLAPGATARQGLSFDALHAKHPRLIVCDISGYGSDGPYRDKKAYDLLIQSESGFLSTTGTKEELAKALMFLYLDVDKRREMGAAGMERVRMNFSPRTVALRFQNETSLGGLIESRRRETEPNL